MDDPFKFYYPDCPYFRPLDNRMFECTLATEWAGVLCHVRPKACTECFKQGRPRDRNRVTASIVSSQVRRQQGLEEWKRRWPEFVNYIDPLTPLGEGPGTELHKLLGNLGFKPDRTCKCLPMARQMNAGGPEWCYEHMEEIIDVMRAEAEKRRMPFSHFVAHRLVKTAIRRSRKYE